MKRVVLLLCIALLVISNGVTAFYFLRRIKEYENINNIQKDIIINDDKSHDDKPHDEDSDSELINDMIRHISLAEDTMRYIKLDSIESLIDIWANGIMEMNGVMQYAAMSTDLQQEFKDYLASNNNFSWITDRYEYKGYEITDINNVSEKVSLVKVSFLKSEEEVDEVSLSLVQDDQNRWSINSIWM